MSQPVQLLLPFLAHCYSLYSPPAHHLESQTNLHPPPHFQEACRTMHEGDDDDNNGDGQALKYLKYRHTGNITKYNIK